MKISRILAGVSALALAASMVAINASAAETEYLYTVKKSWNGDAPADSVEGQIKFMPTDPDPANQKLGACDLNEWRSGAGKFNGQWAQYVLSNDDLSSVSLKFTVVADGDTTWEYHDFDASKSDDENSYCVFTIFGNTEKIAWDEIADENQTGEWTYTYDSATIQAAIDDGKAEFGANGDGTYTLGFNVQLGHQFNAVLTGEITADNLYTIPDDGGNSSSTTDSSSTASTGSSSTGSTASTGSTGSSSKSSSSSKSGSTGGSTSKSSSAAGGTGSIADDSGSTGAAAGIALAGIALAGAALVVSKKK